MTNQTQQKQKELVEWILKDKGVIQAARRFGRTKTLLDEHDLKQEVCCRVLSKKDLIGKLLQWPEKRRRAYLVRIMRNAAIDLLGSKYVTLRQDLPENDVLSDHRWTRLSDWQYGRLEATDLILKTWSKCGDRGRFVLKKALSHESLVADKEHPRTSLRWRLRGVEEISKIATRILGLQSEQEAITIFFDAIRVFRHHRTCRRPTHASADYSPSEKDVLLIKPVPFLPIR